MLRLLGIALLLTGCAYLSGDSEYVIERNKAEAPAWVDLEKEKFILMGDEYQFHYESPINADLPLGLKVAQQQSLEKSEVALKILIDATLVKKMSNERVREVSSVKQYQDFLEAIIKDSYKRYVKINDIYFEKLRKDNARSSELAEYYRVQTLQTISKANLSMILRELATKCAKSQNSILKRFGTELVGTLES